MTLSSAPWWCAPVLALAWMRTVPAQIFCAPTRAKLIAAARFIPGVCGVLVSSWSPGMTFTPWVFQSMPLVSWWSLICPARKADFENIGDQDHHQRLQACPGDRRLARGAMAAIETGRGQI